MKSKFSIIHHVDQETIDRMFNSYSPVFVLSTGRSGSKFMAKLFNSPGEIRAYHEPSPSLMYFSNFAFHNQNENKILEKMFLSARMELIIKEFIKDVIYFESNQCLTFFAPSIINVFKHAKFIHLVRHPGDFVRSAIRKGFHKNDSIWESGRVKIDDNKIWEKMGHIEKLSWVWNTTNFFIEELKQKIGNKRVYTCKLEDISKKEKIKELLSFIGAKDVLLEQNHMLHQKIENKFRIRPNEPLNMKKTENFPFYSDWDYDTKTEFKNTVGNLAIKYGYEL